MPDFKVQRLKGYTEWAIITASTADDAIAASLDMDMDDDGINLLEVIVEEIVPTTFGFGRRVVHVETLRPEEYYGRRKKVRD